jgi:hypothetical protein
VILNLGRFPALIYLCVRTLFFNFMKKISFGGYGGRAVRIVGLFLKDKRNE